MSRLLAVLLAILVPLATLTACQSQNAAPKTASESAGNPYDSSPIMSSDDR